MAARPLLVVNSGDVELQPEARLPNKAASINPRCRAFEQSAQCLARSSPLVTIPRGINPIGSSAAC
jgi:hypothetical protein